MTWHRVSRAHRCKVCGKDSWCGFTDAGLICCMRVPSEKVSKNGGWFHEVAGYQPPAKRRSAQPVIFDAERYVTWLRTRQDDSCVKQMDSLGRQLGGVPASFLASEGAMWEKERGAVAFAMMDQAANVIGVRLRWHTGDKGSIPGSKSGIIFPKGEKKAHTVFVVEGQTDYLLMRYFGFYCIGRQSCLGCEEMVAGVCDRVGAKTVIIVPDVDEPQSIGDCLKMPGRSGAVRLADKMQCHVLLRHPQAKDVRQWVLRDGHDKVKKVIESWQLKPITNREQA